MGAQRYHLTETVLLSAPNISSDCDGRKLHTMIRYADVLSINMPMDILLFSY